MHYLGNKSKKFDIKGKNYVLTKNPFPKHQTNYIWLFWFFLIFESKAPGSIQSAFWGPMKVHQGSLNAASNEYWYTFI